METQVRHLPVHVICFKNFHCDLLAPIHPRIVTTLVTRHVVTNLKFEKLRMLAKTFSTSFQTFAVNPVTRHVMCQALTRHIHSFTHSLFNVLLTASSPINNNKQNETITHRLFCKLKAPYSR